MEKQTKEIKMKCIECGKDLSNEKDGYGHDCEVGEDITKKQVYKITCEYYIYANDKDEVIDFIAQEDNLVESHFIIEEGDKNRWGINDDDIYNHPKFN